MRGCSKSIFSTYDGKITPLFHCRQLKLTVSGCPEILRAKQVVYSKDILVSRAFAAVFFYPSAKADGNEIDADNFQIVNFSVRGCSIFI